MQKEMKEVKCPKCGAGDVEFIDQNHHELMWRSHTGYEEGIYDCPHCRIRFGIWTDFEIKITNVEVDWVEDWEEDCVEDEEAEE